MWVKQSGNNFPNSEQLASFWLHLLTELRFGTVLHYKAEECECSIEKLLSGSNVTAATLVWSDLYYRPYLKEKQNVNILGLVCLAANSYNTVLNALSVMLNHMREVPLLLQLCDKDSSRVELQLQLSRDILKKCQDLLIPNALLLFSDFFKTGTFYGYRMFPTFGLLSQVYNATSPLYPYKLANLQGQVLRTRPDLSQPYVVMYKDRNGNAVTSGMLWRILSLFAKKLNATLELSLDPTLSQVNSIRSGYFKLLEQAQNNDIDVTISIYPMTMSSRSDIPMFSTPVAVRGLCTMLPVERMVSPRAAIRGVLESPWMWVYIAIIYYLTRWIRKRQFLGRALLILIPSLIQLTLLCTVVAQLSALFIHPQRLQFISNLDQLQAAGLRIVGLQSGFNQYPEEMRIKYASTFISYQNMTKFVLLRNSLNTSYGYTVFGLKWHFYAELQSYFKRPLFRYSTDICIFRQSLNSLLFRENFLHRHQLNLYIVRLRQSGILNFYMRHNFYDLLHAGHHKLEDLSPQNEIAPLKYTDIDFVLLLYGYAMAASILIFVIELLSHYINVCLNTL
ncbi:uncharacterized protein Dmoj_GI24835 [Drosophila mojavensis]|uniref:Ionotropic glutamate receptor C-terminal domain-containing protein n=1 Tax=Drosophila mojavensis TaxID=7230 RepID=B4K893_DROMO|nr:uncharacterized protein Dmoj_GI24835 [Drosophila mojavensis]